MFQHLTLKPHRTIINVSRWGLQTLAPHLQMLLALDRDSTGRGVPVSEEQLAALPAHAWQPSPKQQRVQFQQCMLLCLPSALALSCENWRWTAGQVSDALPWCRHPAATAAARVACAARCSSASFAATTAAIVAAPALRPRWRRQWRQRRRPAASASKTLSRALRQVHNACTNNFIPKTFAC